METLESIKQEFKDRTVKQGQAFREGSGKKANHQHKKIWQLYERVKSMNRLDLFKDFLDDDLKSLITIL